MTKKKSAGRYIGSCGIYLIVDIGDGSVPKLLVHRRSRQVSEANMIAGPGGIVERPNCPPSTCSSPVPGVDFNAGARKTAAKELLEETGVCLDEEQIAEMQELPVGDGTYWGAHLHRNYCAVLHSFPAVTGPEKASRHEVVLSGMKGIGEEAGDGYHAWVGLDELLARTDLMKGCRTPLEYFLENSAKLCAGEVLELPRPPSADTGSSAGGSGAGAAAAGVGGPAPKRMRGSVAGSLPSPYGSVGLARPRNPYAGLASFYAGPPMRPAWSGSGPARPPYW
mmetsp:Transcript_120884/g.226090  ORF Transcript_120884/g.226090 Transcript_120884/m.226090 type:complete len:280 (+) Transcript_120884:86-925(+)